MRDTIISSHHCCTRDPPGWHHNYIMPIDWYRRFYSPHWADQELRYFKIWNRNDEVTKHHDSGHHSFQGRHRGQRGGVGAPSHRLCCSWGQPAPLDAVTRCVDGWLTLDGVRGNPEPHQHFLWWTEPRRLLVVCHALLVIVFFCFIDRGFFCGSFGCMHPFQALLFPVKWFNWVHPLFVVKGREGS